MEILIREINSNENKSLNKEKIGSAGFGTVNEIIELSTGKK